MRTPAVAILAAYGSCLEGPLLRVLLCIQRRLLVILSEITGREKEGHTLIRISPTDATSSTTSSQREGALLRVFIPMDGIPQLCNDVRLPASSQPAFASRLYELCCRIHTRWICRSGYKSMPNCTTDHSRSFPQPFRSFRSISSSQAQALWHKVSSISSASPSFYS